MKYILVYGAKLPYLCTLYKNIIMKYLHICSDIYEHTIFFKLLF